MLVSKVFFPAMGSNPWTFRKEMSSYDLAMGFNVGMVKKEIRREE